MRRSAQKHQWPSITRTRRALVPRMRINRPPVLVRVNLFDIYFLFVMVNINDVEHNSMDTSLRKGKNKLGIPRISSDHNCPMMFSSIHWPIRIVKRVRLLELTSRCSMVLPSSDSDTRNGDRSLQAITIHEQNWYSIFLDRHRFARE